METTFFRAGRNRLRSFGVALQRAARVVVVLSLIVAFEVAFPDGGEDDLPRANASVARAARLIGLGTQTLVTLSGTGGNIRGITSDGTNIYMWRSGDNTKMWEVPHSSITPNPGGSRSVTPTSWTIVNAPNFNDKTQLVYSSGCLFLFDTSGSLHCIDTATRTASVVSAPAGKPFPAGSSWVTGSLIGFPDGRIGKVGQASGTNTTVRVYSVSGVGASATLSFDRDLTLVDSVSGWPSDDHGAATDGIYLYRTNYMTGGYKVWEIQYSGNSSVVFNGDGSGACGASGTFCNINPSVGGFPILSNATFLGRDHARGHLLVGDYDGARFYMTEAANPGNRVTYDTQGGASVAAATWIQGTSLTLPTPTRPGYTFDGWSTTAAGSTLVYQTTTSTRSGNAIVYSSGYGKAAGDVAATLTNNGTTFSRVRYRMEAKYSGTLRYADVSFDKWSGATIASLAVPDLNDARTIKENVSNLSIDSNWPGFAGVASAVTTGTGKSGRLELWPFNYSQSTSGVLPVGDGSVYDEDDTSVGPGSGSHYGSFQVHNLTDDQTVLAWNRHFESNPDIGFGNNLQSCLGLTGNTDWTFCRQTNFDLSTWKLQIFIGDLLAGGSTYTPANTSDFTLYAQWTANPLTVTYDSQGGSAISSGSTVTGGSIASSPGTPTRAGYTFAGWFAASNGGSAITFPYTHGQTSNFTLYAQWTANPLTVTYDSRGGSAISSGSTVTGGSIASSPGTPTRAGYTFAGWFAASSGGSAITFPYTHGRTSNFTLYAQWLQAQTGFSITGAPGSLAYNATVTLGTSGGNGSGAVVFATTTPGVCSVNANTGLVTMLVSSGSCGIAATKAGDANYDATSTSVTISATKAAQSTLTVTGSASGTYGATVALSTSGGTTGGAVTWSDGSSTACTVNSSGSVSIIAGTGSCVVTATMAGNGNYFAVESAGFTITVSRATQSALTVTSTSATYRDDLTLTSTGGSGTGAVTWSVVPNTNSTCSISGVVLTPGDAGSTCVVRVTKAQDANWSARSSANTTITVEKASQTGFSVTSASSFTTGSSLSLTTAGGQSTGGVSWSLQSGSCTLSGATLTSARGGIVCSVQATRAGDSNWFSVSDTQVISVDKIVQNISFRSTPPSPATVGTTYAVTVDSTAFLSATIVIANQSSAVCSVSAGVVSFNSVGTCVISASQSGNDVYTVAAASQSVTVVTAASAASQPSSDVAAPAGSGASPSSSVPTTTTVAATRRSTVGAVTTTTSSTTTTTTTTIPVDPTSPQTGVDGLPPDLGAGEVTALVRGKSVKVKVEKLDESLVLTLPNDVKVTIGRLAPGGSTVAVASDGVLRIYRDELADIAVDGLVPGTTYTVFMFSDPIELGRGVVNAAGGVEVSVQVPDDAEYGEHTLQFNGVGPGGEIVSTSVGFQVLERENNTWLVVLALSVAVLLALLGGRPIFSRRRRNAAMRSV